LLIMDEFSGSMAQGEVQLGAIKSVGRRQP